MLPESKQKVVRTPRSSESADVAASAGAGRVVRRDLYDEFERRVLSDSRLDLERVWVCLKCRRVPSALPPDSSLVMSRVLPSPQRGPAGFDAAAAAAAVGSDGAEVDFGRIIDVVCRRV